MSLTTKDKQDIRGLIREEVAGIRTDVSGIHIEIDGMHDQLRYQATLIEDLDHKFDTALELLRGSVDVKQQVATQDDRVTILETDNQLLKDTVAVHPRQLKGLLSHPKA